VHRKPLLELLLRYAQRHPEEAACVERVRGLVESRADCFERTALPGHLTGSAFVLSADLREVLLVHHRKLDRWLQPGGHADGECDLARVALREAQEETGLHPLAFLGPEGIEAEPTPFDLDVHTIPARPGEPAHEHHDVRFLLVAGPGANARVSEESFAVRWFPLGDLEAQGVDESVLRMAGKTRARLASAAKD
jgi:8-oxo-dGTP pyrophosphatase MutT (NUDIX family)